MRFSNKSALFLCLILMAAFVAVPVMAHEGTAGNLDHDHPLMTTKVAVDINGNDTPGEDTVPGEAAIEPHNAHPTPTIKLMDDDMFIDILMNHPILVPKDDPATTVVTTSGSEALNYESMFSVYVKFDRKVNTANGTAQTVTPPDLLASENILVRILDNTGDSVYYSTTTALATYDVRTPPSDGDVDVQIEREGTYGDTYKLTFYLGSDFVPDLEDEGDGSGDNDTFTILMQIDKGAAFSLSTATAGPIREGGASLASSEVRLLIHGEDETGPIATITGMQADADTDDDMNDGYPNFEVTITFDEPVMSGESLTADKITVTNGEISNVMPHETEENAYTGLITPNYGVTEVTVQVDEMAVKDRFGNANDATPATAYSITVADIADPNPKDETKPLVDVSDGELNTATKNVAFTITVTEANPGDDNSVGYPGEITVTNGTVVSYDGGVLTVEPTSDKVAVTVTVEADAVIDKSGNKSAKAMGKYEPDGYVAPTPTITITAGDEMVDGTATGKIVFIINLSETPENKLRLRDIDVVNGPPVLLSAALMMEETPMEGYAETYKLTVDPADDTKAVRVTIKTGALVVVGTGEDARDFDGDSEPHTLTPTAPAKVAGLMVNPGNAQVVLTWTALTENVTGYEYSKDDGAAWMAVTDSMATTATHTVTGLTNGTQYTFKVRGVNGATKGPASNSMTAAPREGTDPTTPANIFRFEVPGKPADGRSFVILVRDADVQVGGSPPASLKSRFAGIVDINNARVIPDAKIIEWSAMPDLAELFDRDAAGGGGALVLRKSVGDTAAPAIGTVGISEIMWAMDAGYIGQTKARDTQWIEIENLNAAPKTVLIYAQTGAQFTDTKGNTDPKDDIVTTTQAGDTIHGNPSGMVVDVMTNYFDGSDRGTDSWDVPGDDGSSKTGINFVSMARKGTFDLASKHDGKYNKRYVKTTGSENSLDGRSEGSWEASEVRYDRDTTDKPASVTTAVPATFDYLGTPGRANTFSVSTHITTAGITNLNDTPPVLFNEIGNRSDSDKAYEWIEIRNTTSSPVSLKSYRITTITAVGTENILYTFPHDKAADVPANGVLLLLASDPAEDTDHPIAVGYNVDKVPDDQAAGSRGDHIPRYKVTPFAGNGLPNGNFVLVLRRPDTVENKNEGGKGPSETGNNDLDKIVDIAGHHSNLSKANYPNAVSRTSFWPLHNFPAPQFSNNNLTENNVHYRRNPKSNKDDRLGTGAWDNDNGKSAYQVVGYTGIGYKRWVPRDGRYGGDPGYHNPLVNLTTDVKDDVTISEIMLSTGDNGRLPQWIELTNNSKTKTINLKSEGGWRLVIEAPGDPIRTINFKDWDNGNYIYPNQTVLIVAGSVGRGAQAGSDILRSNVVFKADRVFNVLREYGSNFSQIEVDGEMVKNDRYRFVHPTEFNIRLIDGKNNVADEIGNLDGNGRTNDTPAWEYPEGLTKDGDRTSFIRVYDDGVARAAVGSDAIDVLPVNTRDARLDLNDVDSVIPAEYAWIRAEILNFDSIYVRHTWYGSQTDFGTPGARKGQPLPVSLSFFRPTLEDGKVVIRWTTESELDNAGFNILRSQDRNGEFTKVNDQLIQGKGTTAERSTYKWVDTSVKPGAVYYYQIEDVSFAGERNMLTTTKLKGLISAKDKLTTKWGELKEVQ